MSVVLTEYDVFISYRHEDGTEFAEKLAQHFKRNDIKFFRDKDQLKAGQKISERCKKAINNSKVFLPIISKTYCDGFTNDEFFHNQKEARKPLVVVVMPWAAEKIPHNYKLEDVLQVRLKEDYREEERKHLDKILVGVMEHLKSSGMNIILWKL